MAKVKFLSNKMCSVPQCDNRAMKGSISLHSFPSDARLKKVWQTKLRIGRPITPYMRVCSCHFTRSDFSWTTLAMHSPNKRRLKKGAVPSMCLPVRTHERRAGAAQLRAQEAATRQDVPQLATNSPPPSPSDFSSPEEVETSAKVTSEDLEAAEILLGL